MSAHIRKPEAGDRISKNFILGYNILVASQLTNLSLEKRSVYHPNYGIKPAAVICKMPFDLVCHMLTIGSLYFIIKKPLEEKPWYNSIQK